MIGQKQVPVQPCPPCVAAWVDRASAAPGLKLTDLERRRLIAALLTRPHLILSGPAGAGKRRLASALALAIAQPGGRPGPMTSPTTSTCRRSSVRGAWPTSWSLS